MTFVRDSTGTPLLCCWDDCERPGHEENKLTRTEGSGDQKRTLHYVFCSLAHRALYENAHASYGNLSPAGPSRSPLGLIVP